MAVEVTFNSLFEMPDGRVAVARRVAVLHDLSILYLRCDRNGVLVRVLRRLELSILYLRCPRGKYHHALLNLLHPFQFSI